MSLYILTNPFSFPVQFAGFLYLTSRIWLCIIRCMNYIIFDLEWNQCPDGKEREKKELPFEILEIGAIKLNSERQEIDRFHEFIRPTVYKRLHFKTREIVHISPDELKKADYFPDVLERFSNWCGSDALFCTWGSLDLLELQRNIRYHKLKNFFPFPLKFYDIQKIFSLTFEDGKSRRSLKYAVDMLQIEKDIPFHEALSDAYYTTIVMKHMKREQILPFFSVDYFRVPRKRSEELHYVFKGYDKFVSRKFSTRAEAVRDRVVRSCKCYICGKTTTRKLPWYSNGGKTYRNLSYCEEHGYIKGKLRLKKTEDGTGYFCVRTLKIVSEKRAEELFQKYEQLHAKKNA